VLNTDLMLTAFALKRSALSCDFMALKCVSLL